MILAVIRHNIGIWSGHHPSYPCSASHPGDTLAHSSSPSLDAFKLLLQKRARCLWDGQTSADDGRRSADLLGWGGGRLSTQSRLLSCPLCRLLVPRSALIALFKRDYWLTDCHLRGLRPEHFWWYLRGDICSPPAWSGYEIFTTFTLQRHIHLVPAVFVDERMQSKRSNTLSCIILLCVPCCTFHGLGGSFPQSQITCSACSRAVLRCPTAAFCLWCCPACVKGVGGRSHHRHGAWFRSQDEWRELAKKKRAFAFLEMIVSLVAIKLYFTF